MYSFSNAQLSQLSFSTEGRPVYSVDKSVKFAHARALTCMCAKMGAQVALRREVLVAHLARMPLAHRRLVVHVAEVQPQLAGRVEPLRTQLAAVRVRRCVPCEVVMQVRATDERPAAQLAHVRLLAVQRQVAAQVAGEWEPAPACVTLIWALPRMRPLVQNQSLLLRETAAACLADVQPGRWIQRGLAAVYSNHGFVRRRLHQQAADKQLASFRIVFGGNVVLHGLLLVMITCSLSDIPLRSTFWPLDWLWLVARSPATSVSHSVDFFVWLWRQIVTGICYNKM